MYNNWQRSSGKYHVPHIVVCFPHWMLVYGQNISMGKTTDFSLQSRWWGCWCLSTSEVVYTECVLLYLFVASWLSRINFELILLLQLPSHRLTIVPCNFLISFTLGHDVFILRSLASMLTFTYFLDATGLSMISPECD